MLLIVGKGLNGVSDYSGYLHSVYCPPSEAVDGSGVQEGAGLALASIASWGDEEGSGWNTMRTRQIREAPRMELSL